MALGAVLAPGAVAAKLLPPLAGGEPDLVVEQIFSQTWVPGDGSVVQNVIFIDVGNWGAAAAAPSRLYFQMRDITGRSADAVGVDGQGTTSGGWLDVPALAKGGDSARLRVPFAAYAAESPVPGAMGRYHVQAIADAGNVVAESNEANNDLEGDVYGGEAVPMK